VSESPKASIPADSGDVSGGIGSIAVELSLLLLSSPETISKEESELRVSSAAVISSVGNIVALQVSDYGYINTTMTEQCQFSNPVDAENVTTDARAIKKSKIYAIKYEQCAQCIHPIFRSSWTVSLLELYNIVKS
jgi:hypothetical protein